MNKALVVMMSASLALWGCGSDGGGGSTQSELADLLVGQDVGVGFDEQCVRDKTEELSDEDAQFLIDNIDATDTEGFSAELQDWADGLIDCLEDPEMTDASDTSDSADEVESTDGPATTTAPDETDGPERTDPIESSGSAASDELASIGKSGFSTWVDSSGETLASAAALVINNSGEDLFGTEVTFNFIGADGTPVATESTYVEVIPAGDSFPAQVDTYTDLTAAMPVTVEITAFAEADSYFETDWVELELGPTTITPGEYYSTMSGTVTNTADEPFDFYQIACLILTADGSVVGGSFAYPDRIAPGQTIAWETTVQEGSLQAGGVDAECRSIAALS